MEENRKGLEDLLARLISHPDISSDPDLAAFLQLTERVGIAEEHSKQVRALTLPLVALLVICLPL